MNNWFTNLSENKQIVLLLNIVGFIVCSVFMIFSPAILTSQVVMTYVMYCIFTNLYALAYCTINWIIKTILKWTKK